MFATQEGQRGQNVGSSPRSSQQLSLVYVNNNGTRNPASTEEGYDVCLLRTDRDVLMFNEATNGDCGIPCQVGVFQWLFGRGERPLKPETKKDSGRGVEYAIEVPKNRGGSRELSSDCE